MFNIKNLCLATSVFVMSFLVGYSVLSWTGPTGTAPASNVAAPINVSSTAQTKSGSLTAPILYDSDNNAYYVNPASVGTSLAVAGQIMIAGGSPGAGKLLASDSSGLASWKTVYSIPTLFSYTGANQSFVVPTGVTNVFVELWGASGAGGTPGGWSYGAAGGGGGYTRGIISVTPAETLTVIVGQMGTVNQAAGYGYGGGASGTNNNSDNRYGSGGGGMSAIYRGGTALLIAGGGGGGGSSRAWIDNVGGGGGGLAGANGQSPYDAKFSYGGGGGTQTAGGAATGGQSGTAGQGGHAGTNSYGGGGGGGYWGGAGGGYSEGNTMGGGGGGSGYIGATITAGYTMTGQTGGGGGPSNNGANGLVVIYY